MRYNRNTGSSVSRPVGCSVGGSELHEAQIVRLDTLYLKGGPPMLDPWIIEEILKKEEERRKEQEGNRAELPVYRPDMGEKPAIKPAEESERGVMIIDI